VGHKVVGSFAIDVNKLSKLPSIDLFRKKCFLKMTCQIGVPYFIIYHTKPYKKVSFINNK